MKHMPNLASLLESHAQPSLHDVSLLHVSVFEGIFLVPS